VVFSAVGLYKSKSVASSMSSASRRALEKGKRKTVITALEHAQPTMEPYLAKCGLEWGDVKPVMEAELSTMSSGLESCRSL